MIRYNLSLQNPAHHFFTVELIVDTTERDHVDLEFPAWSPGRYYIYDFVRNVQELRAKDGTGNHLNTGKIAKGTWRIECKNTDEVKISYKIFGNSLSGTLSQLDDRHASINGSSVFGYIVNAKMEPIELAIDAPNNWKVFSSMKSTRSKGQTILRADNYDVLIDSPLEIGKPLHKRFIHQDITYHIILDIANENSLKTASVSERVDQFVADTEATVREYVATFGQPEFDEYYFLVNIDPFAPGGDGMEHLASTRLVINGYITDDETYNDLVDVMSHEFFHIWNVKRMRPAELGPFDYTSEQHTTLLWIAEGFTQYYGHLMPHRAGVWDDKQLYKQLAREINYVDRSPGRFHRNLRESSYDTWHTPSARSPLGESSNMRNTYVNYYHKGAVLALVLDMEIRKTTSDKKSLDDVINLLYKKTYAQQEAGEYFLRGVGYTEEDVLEAVKEIAGNTTRTLLKRMLDRADEITYNRYLKYVGLEAIRGKRNKKESNNSYTGIAPDNSTKENDFAVLANVIEGSPAWNAGLSGGDVIIAIDGNRVNKKGLETVMKSKRPGETIEFTWFRGARLMSASVKTIEKDTRPFTLEVRKNATEEQKRSRRKWLAGTYKAQNKSKR